MQANEEHFVQTFRFCKLEKRKRFSNAFGREDICTVRTTGFPCQYLPITNADENFDAWQKLHFQHGLH